MKTGVTVKDRMASLSKALQALRDTEVLVGIPLSTAEREDDDDNSKHLSNAEIGYIQENGAPEHNLPARPFLVPGVAAVQDKIGTLFGKASKALLDGNEAGFVAAQEAAGIIAVSSVRKTITDNIPPPLSWRTIQGRLRKMKKHKSKAVRDIASAYGKSDYDKYAAGLDSGLQFTALVNTGQLRQAITYVRRKKD